MTWFDAATLHWPIAAAYLAILGVIAAYGLHRYWLLALYARHHGKRYAPVPNLEPLPRVTVQLPIFNEGAIAVRIIDAASHLDYPRDLLQIQVLDDSTDETVEIARERVAYWQQRGLDIQHIHRIDRRGYKAGALANAMPDATGELIAIFDADFVPQTSFLHKTVPHFADPGIGLVQARWEHLNRKRSLLTRAQGVFLDGHFAIEQASRCWSGRFLHFNGTAGVWRRAAITDAGGWSADTLCEDLDLSIRSQLVGWRFKYLPDVICPAEVPPVIDAFKNQQHRWFKGTIQVAFKMLGRIRREPIPLKVKVELFCQLMGPVICPLMVLFSLLYYPAVVQGFYTGQATVVGALMVLLGMCAGMAFYGAAERVVGRGFLYGLMTVPLMIAAGLGISVTNTRGVIEALFRHESPFVRTPKFNDHDDATIRDRASTNGPPKSRRGKVRWVPIAQAVFEVIAGVYMAVCTVLAIRTPEGLAAAPLLGLFAIGYFWFGLGTLLPAMGLTTTARFVAPAPAKPQPETA